MTRRATRHLSRGIRHAIFLTRSDRTRLLSLTGHPSCRAITDRDPDSSSPRDRWRAVAAIGVDEIQYANGHKYLTLVYQIEQQCTRLLWIGRERTVASFEQFFTLIGEELARQIEFVCSDMWQPYLTVIRERCSQAIWPATITTSSALPRLRRRLARDGDEPVLKKTRWCVLKRKTNLTRQQRFRLRDLLRYNLQTARAYLLKDPTLLVFRRRVAAGRGGSGSSRIGPVRMAGAERLKPVCNPRSILLLTLL